jgi:hypothetical protein
MPAMTRLHLLLVGFALCSVWNSPLFSQVQTKAERTNYVETSRYEDVVAFLNTVAKGSRIVHNTSFGYTFEGRSLPLVVVGRVADGSPRAVRASGKLRIYIQANIQAKWRAKKRCKPDTRDGCRSACAVAGFDGAVDCAHL